MATRFANSNITANMVQFDRSVSLTVHLGNKAGSTTIGDFEDTTLKQGVADALRRAESARETAEPPVLFEVVNVSASVGVEYEWKYLPARRGRPSSRNCGGITLVHRYGAEGWTDAPARMTC